MEQPMEFDAWWKALKSIAKSHDLEWLLGGQEEFRDAWEDGMTPGEAMGELYEDAARDM